MPFAGWRVEPMDGPYGAVIHGVELAEGFDEQLAARLLASVCRHKVVVLPGQSIGDAAYVRFGRYFGQPINFFKEDHRGRKHPELIRVTNATSVPVEHRDGAVQWHNDSSYEEVPASFTMLYCKEAPEAGGVTLFADIGAAFDALPLEEQERLRPLTALHTMLGAPWLDEERSADMTAPAGMGEFRYPFVLNHPETGRAALYPSATARTIEGWDECEARKTILAIRRHITSPAFRQSYKMNAGDIMIWDNFALAHSATPIEYTDEPGKRRVLDRISTKGRAVVRPVEWELDLAGA